MISQFKLFMTLTLIYAGAGVALAVGQTTQPEYAMLYTLVASIISIAFFAVMMIVAVMTREVAPSTAILMIIMLGVSVYRFMVLTGVVSSPFHAPINNTLTI